MRVCVCAHESRCLCRIADGMVSPGAKVISSCVLSIVGAGTHLDPLEEQHLLLNLKKKTNYCFVFSLEDFCVRQCHLQIDIFTLFPPMNMVLSYFFFY